MMMRLALVVVQCVFHGGLALTRPPRVILVPGATGRTGRLVVDRLLASDATTTVKCLVRNVSKAAAVLPREARVVIEQVDLEDAKAVAAATATCDGAIWCATGVRKAASEKGFRSNLSVFFFPSQEGDQSCHRDSGREAAAREKARHVEPDGVREH